MENVLPVVGVTSIFYLAIACLYDIYLRSKFVYIRKEIFDDLYISREEAAATRQWEEHETQELEPVREPVGAQSADRSPIMDFIGQFHPVIKLNMSGEIVETNHLCCSIFEYSLQEMVNRNIDELIDPACYDDKEHLWLWEQLNQGKSVEREYRLIGAVEKTSWVEISFIPLEEGYSGPYAVICLVKDITEKKATVDQIRKKLLAVFNEKMQSTPDNNFNDELQRVAKSINDLVDRLLTLLSEIGDASKYVHTSAQEMSSSNAQLNSRTDAQATSVQIISAAIDAFTRGIKDYTLEVEQATDKTHSALENLQAIEIAVADKLVNMHHINDVSEKINSALKRLDDIAFQTNVLALDSVVEAARAGEHGTGFVSVANEVKDLAASSAQVVQEIKVLIKDSRDAVDEAVDMTNQTGQHVETFSGNIKEICVRVSQIDSISKEQADSVGDVLQTVVLLNEITNKNAALVEQASIHSRTMEEQSRSLRHQVSLFDDSPISYHQPSVEPFQNTESFVTVDDTSERVDSTTQVNTSKAIVD